MVQWKRNNCPRLFALFTLCWCSFLSPGPCLYLGSHDLYFVLHYYFVCDLSPCRDTKWCRDNNRNCRFWLLLGRVYFLLQTAVCMILTVSLNLVFVALFFKKRICFWQDWKSNTSCLLCLCFCSWTQTLEWASAAGCFQWLGSDYILDVMLVADCVFYVVTACTFLLYFCLYTAKNIHLSVTLKKSERNSICFHCSFTSGAQARTEIL